MLEFLKLILKNFFAEEIFCSENFFVRLEKFFLELENFFWKVGKIFLELEKFF